MPTHYIKQNDLSPSIQDTLTDSAGAAINITSATIRFHMFDRAGVSKIDAAGSIVGAGTAGVVKYDWTGTDTDTAGFFDAEFEVTYAADSKPETFPNSTYILVVITDDLA